MQLLKKIRPSAYAATAFMFIFQSLVFFLSKLINTNFRFYDLTISLDRSLPFIGVFIIPYVLTYFFWGINYVYLGVTEKKNYYNLIASGVVLIIISGLCFVFLPTTISRPDDVGDGVLGWITRFIYEADTPAINLFPSLHCLSSWLCVCAMRGREEIPKWYRVFTTVFAVIICLSTQFVKQHYIADLVSGVAFAEIGFYLVGKTNLYKPFEKIFDKLDDAFYKRFKKSEKKEDLSTIAK